MMKRNGRYLVSMLMALCLLFVSASGAFADNYASNEVTFDGMIRRDAPKETADPIETEAPEEAAEETADPEATADPEETAGPEETAEATADPEATPEDAAYQRDEEGNLILDENGNPIPVETETPEEEPEAETIVYERDENGGLVLNENGDPIIAYLPEGMTAPTAYERDENGGLVLNENGDPIIAYLPEGMTAPTAYERDENGALLLDENGDPIPAAAETPEALPETIVYERDEEGNLILDENGDPIIAYLPEGMTAPTAYERDENGALILDENGDPIPVTEDATEILLNPDRYVEMALVGSPDDLYFGHEATLAATAVGYDNCEIAYQWQYSLDNVEWLDMEGETSDQLTLTVTEENYLYYWRVTVTVLSVNEPFAAGTADAAVEPAEPAATEPSAE